LATAFVGLPADSVYGLDVGRTGQAYPLELLLGVSQAGWYTTIQSTMYGCCDMTLALNPGGGYVGIGTTNPQYLLSVNGQIGAKEVIVTNTGWSDYVFRPEYRLWPLSEVGAYIEANHHLPDIPSEAEVREKGVSIGDMQSKLLAKIEEITLHMIQQDKENRGLRERIAQLEAQAAAVPPGPGVPATVR
jgi:hypothetical protein